MKHIKLVLSISVVLVCTTLKSQSFFINGATYYTFEETYSLTPGVRYANYFKELLVLDSTNSNGEYYTINYTKNDIQKKDSFTYQLRVKNDSVYFTGNLINRNIGSVLVKDLLISDFTQKPGDTLKIVHTGSGLKEKFKLDSIGYGIFQDNIKRQVFYYVGGTNPERKTLFVIKGLGSDFGLVPFRMTDREKPYWQDLISICKSSLVFSNSKFSQLKNNDYCDEDSINRMVKKLQVGSNETLIANRFKIYPNPVNTELSVQIIAPTNNLRVEIADYTGKIIYQATNPIITNNRVSIDFSGYAKGFYTLVLHSDTGLINQKIIK